MELWAVEVYVGMWRHEMIECILSIESEKECACNAVAQ